MLLFFVQQHTNHIQIVCKMNAVVARLCVTGFVFVCCNLLGVKGVQVEEIWSFDPESFSQIKYDFFVINVFLYCSCA